MSVFSKTLVILMGVSGCGKSSVAQALSAATDWPWLEGDDFHSPANIAKMAGGTPLTDADRTDWVRAMADESAVHASSTLILACSALTPFVQRGLAEQSERRCVWIYLQGSSELISGRLGARRGHFMDAGLLDSQFAALDVPPQAIAVPIDQPVANIISDIRKALDE